MIELRDAAESADPADALEPTQSTDAADPIEPIDRIEPIEPIDSTELCEPMQRIESSDQSDHLLVDTAPSCTGPGRGGRVGRPLPRPGNLNGPCGVYRRRCGMPHMPWATPVRQFQLRRVGRARPRRRRAPGRGR